MDSVDDLRDMIALTNDDAEFIIELAVTSRGRLERAPGKSDNWIEANGKLPRYIEDVAVSLHEKRGMSISHAIAVAISRIKRWAATSKDPKVKAKAVKALAQWEALKAKARAKRAKPE